MRRTMQMLADDLDRERPRASDEPVHFTEALVEAVLTEHTDPGDRVLDPFAGYGTVLSVCERLGRTAVGVELLDDRVELIRRRLSGSARVLEGDARDLDRMDVGQFELCLTSPPYMTADGHPQNPLTGYRTLDGDYRTYLAELGAVFAHVARHLRPDGVLVINAATLRTGGHVTPLAWDLAAAVGRHLRFLGETYLEWDRPPSHVSGDYLLTFGRY